MCSKCCRLESNPKPVSHHLELWNHFDFLWEGFQILSLSLGQTVSVSFLASILHPVGVRLRAGFILRALSLPVYVCVHVCICFIWLSCSALAGELSLKTHDPSPRHSSYQSHSGTCLHGNSPPIWMQVCFTSNEKLIKLCDYQCTVLIVID